MTPAYTSNQEMSEYIQNTINSIAYAGYDTISDVLESYILSYLKINHFARLEIVYLICLLRNGVGSLKQVTSSLPSLADSPPTQNEDPLSEYSLLSIHDNNDTSSSHPACILVKSQLTPFHVIPITNAASVSEWFHSLAFWNTNSISMPCKESQYIQHILLCIIQQCPLTNPPVLYFTHSKATNHYFNTIISNMTTITNIITNNEADQPLFMRRIHRCIEKWVHHFKVQCIHAFNASYSYWKCNGSTKNAPFNSIIAIQSSVASHHMLFHSVVDLLQMHPMAMGFELLTNKYNSCINELRDIVSRVENEFVYYCCTNDSRNEDVGEELRYIHKQQHILAKIDKKELQKMIYQQKTMMLQLRAVVEGIKAMDDLISLHEKRQGLDVQNKLLACLMDPAIEHVIELVCFTFISFTYKQCLLNYKYLLRSKTSFSNLGGTVAMEIDMSVVGNLMIDKAYKLPVVLIHEKKLELEFDTKSCAVRFKNGDNDKDIAWLNEMIHCKLLDCLLKLTRRIVIYSSIPCKVKYTVFLTTMLNRNRDNLRQLVAHGQCGKMVEIQPFVCRLLENGCCPSDVIREYDRVTL